MNEFNFEKWLLEHSNWEDMDSTILISPAGPDGGFGLSDYEAYIVVDGKTLEEACTNFCQEETRRWPDHKCSFNV